MHLVLLLLIGTTLLQQLGWAGLAEVLWYAATVRMTWCLRLSVAAHAFAWPVERRVLESVDGFYQAGAPERRTILTRQTPASTTIAA